MYKLLSEIFRIKFKNRNIRGDDLKIKIFVSNTFVLSTHIVCKL